MMSETILRVTVKLEMNALGDDLEVSAPNSGGAMMIGKKRNRIAVKMEDTRVVKRQKELKNPCHGMIHDGFPRDFSKLVKVELKESDDPMLLKDLQENLDNPVSSQSSESDDEPGDEFDPWAEIFASTYDLNSGLGRESTPPQSIVEGDHLTWAQRYLSSV